MNTNQLKKFAQNARRKLLQQVGAKLEYILTHDTAELREKASHIQKLKEELNRIGKDQLIEKVAYTWFNRLMALRFMDANDYQPSGIRIVSPKEGYTLPQILDEAKQGGLVDGDWQTVIGKVNDLLDGKMPSRNPQNEAYRYLLIAACNALHQQFPFLFERINDYTELLLPDDLTSEFSIVNDVVEGMSSEDCQEVEVIGWLYQFYISEKKDEVFAAKGKVKKEDIPAATQLFTPRWIVEYMVQNTLGKLWLQNRPGSRLRDFMPYFIVSPSGGGQGEDYLQVSGPEEIKLLDQACGSGHILVYAFELLTKIYEEEGYNSSDIPKLIIENNLYGFEIDERAAQLAGLSLLMKARSYYRRLFRKEVQPNILCFEDVKFVDGELEQYLGSMPTNLFNQSLKADLQLLEQATNLGSLMQFQTKDLPRISASLPDTDIFLAKTHTKMLAALRQMSLLNQKYHCIVDNPPYMGGGNMNKSLSDYVKKNYPDSKADLMTCFMESGLFMLKPKGLLGMINLPSWLFLSSFEKLRKKLIANKHIDSLLHMGRGVFGVDWGSTAFIVRNLKLDSPAKYFKLHKRNFQHIYPEDIRDIFLRAKNNSSVKINFDKYREGEGTADVDELIDENGLQVVYIVNQKNFENIPGNPIGYWAKKKLRKLLNSSQLLSEYGSIGKGLDTGNNFRFLRYWYETKQGQDWIPCQKGGYFKKWYGNNDFYIFWKDNGRAIKDYKKSNLRNSKYYLKSGITWNRISSGQPAFRCFDKGQIFESTGPCAFFKEESQQWLLGFLNSKITKTILEIYAPTLDFQSGHISNLPYSEPYGSAIQKLSDLVKNCIAISKTEWDSRETSWDLQKNELLRHQAQDLEETYDGYCQYWKNKFHQLHRNEEELNRQFIEIYGLEEELTPDVPMEEITILKEETKIENGQLVFQADEVFKQFMSYAVGCMFGRYSLDKEGLILANQGEGLAEYRKKVLGVSELAVSEGQELTTNLSFLPDDDAIIPLLDDEWFEDDVVGRFHEFLKVTFGAKDFQKNIAFIEEQLGKDIRKYFVRDFYNDHIKRYKKRPIYWLFSSPKGSFNVLVYLHRYTPDTINNILNNYLREFIQKLKSQKAHFEQIQISGSTTEQNKATKAIDKLDKMILDCEAYERDILFPLATERIVIDLDDGVLVNYNKMGKAVKEVKGLNDKKAKEKVRGFDWIDVAQIRD
jgi:hypothetical protein